MSIKTYASKSGLVKALRNTALHPANYNPVQNDEGRWLQGEVKAVVPAVVNSIAVLRGVAQRTVLFAGKGIKIEKNREERNGLKRPSIGGKCRAVWDQCDALLHANNGMIPMPKALKEWALTNDYNPNNAVIELYQWRKFMGFTKAKA